MPHALLCRNTEIAACLSAKGFDTIEIEPFLRLGDATAYHADLQIFKGADYLIVHRDFPVETVHRLSQLTEVIISQQTLGKGYPADIPFNACFTGNYLIHNTAFTAPEILERCAKNSVSVIDVQQGYARCSALPLAPNALITADEGIASAAECAKIEVLRITPGHCILPGYRYGFIGGCAGVYDNCVYFTGDIRLHPDGEKIACFITAQGLRFDILTNGICIDIGSIFFLD